MIGYVSVSIAGDKIRGSASQDSLQIQGNAYLRVWREGVDQHRIQWVSSRPWATHETLLTSAINSHVFDNKAMEWVLAKKEKEPES